jgi:hypothetical protein
MIDGADRLGAHALLAHDPGADLYQPLGMAEFGRRLQRAVDEQRVQIVITRIRARHQVLPLPVQVIPLQA